MGADAPEVKPYHDTWWFEWLLLAGTLALAWFLLHTFFEGFLKHDLETAVYFKTARALVGGQGYHPSHTGDFLMFADHPPLYPLLLAGIMIATGKNAASALVEPLFYVNFAFYGISVLLVHTFMARRIDRVYALIISVLYALSPLTLKTVASISPEMTYMVFSMLAILAIDRYFSEKLPVVSGMQLFGCCLSLVAAIYTQNTGFALLGAFTLLSIQKLRVMRGLFVLGVILAALSPWFLQEAYHWQFDPAHKGTLEKAVNQSVQGGFSDVKTLLPKPDPDALRHSTQSLDRTLVRTTDLTLGTLNFNYLPELFSKKLSGHLNDSHMNLRFSQIDWVRWLVGGFLAFGLWFGLHQYSGIGSIYVVVTVLLMTFMPGEHNRLMLPVLPLFLFFIYLGVIRLGEGLRGLHLPALQVMVASLTVLMVLTSLGGYWSTFSFGDHPALIAENKRFQRNSSREIPEVFATVAIGGDAASSGEKHPPEPLASLQANSDKPFEHATAWLRSNTPEHVTVMTPRPEDSRAYGARNIRSYPVSGGRSSQNLEQLLAVQYVLEDRRDSSAANRVNSLLASHPERFNLVYTADEVSIWAVVSANTNR